MNEHTRDTVNAVDNMTRRITQLEATNAVLLAALEWIETYVANQPYDALAEFLIVKKIQEAKGEA